MLCLSFTLRDFISGQWILPVSILQPPLLGLIPQTDTGGHAPVQPQGPLASCLWDRSCCNRDLLGWTGVSLKCLGICTAHSLHQEQRASSAGAPASESGHLRFERTGGPGAYSTACIMAFNFSWNSRRKTGGLWAQKWHDSSWPLTGSPGQLPQE